MKELTTYLLESLACGGVLYACYRLLLDRRVAFGWAAAGCSPCRCSPPSSRCCGFPSIRAR